MDPESGRLAASVLAIVTSPGTHSVAAGHSNRLGQAGPQVVFGQVVTADSEASWNEFRDQVLMPRLQAGVAGGFTTPPQESSMEVYKLLR